MNIKYNKIIERYKQYLISLSFDKVAWFGLNEDCHSAKAEDFPAWLVARLQAMTGSCSR